MNERTTASKPRRKMRLAIPKMLWLGLWATATATAAPTLTIQPEVTDVASCLAFGAAPGSGVEGEDLSGFVPTSPNMGFIYQDIPAFELSPGDILAFDLGDVNDFDVELDIDMATTTANGETDDEPPFVKVVSNTYTPLKARGDTIIDNFDLRFLVDNAYSFPGGGLIIRFSNGSTAYRADNETCDQVGVVGSTTDPTGNFLLAFWDDDDGVAPWGPMVPPIDLQREFISGFQIIEGPTVLLASDTLDQANMPITTAMVGDTITYRVTAQNPDASDITGVTVTATLDDLVSFNQTTQNPPATAVFDAGPPATIEWSIGSLAAGAEATLEVEVDIPFAAGGQTISNLAEVTETDAPFVTGLVDQSDVEVDAAINIAGEMQDSIGATITAVAAGEPFVYRLDVDNPGPLDGSGVEMLVTLPENMLFQQVTATPSVATVFDIGPPETIVWPIGDLSSETSAALDIDVIALFAASGTILTGTAAQTAPSEDEDVTTPVTVQPALNISSRSLDAGGSVISTAQTGAAIRYEVVVRNDSQAAATGFEVTATLADELDVQQSTPTPPAGTTLDVGPPTTVVWDVDTLAPGAEAMLVVDLNVPFPASGQSVSNQAEITGSDAAQHVGDMSAATVTIDAAIEIAETIQDSSGTEISNATVGDSIQYRVIVSNTGGADASGLEVTATFADSLTFRQAVAQETAVFSAGTPATVVWSLGALAAGADATLDVELDVAFAASGQLINFSAEMTDADATLVVGLNEASELTITDSAADLLTQGSGNCFIATAAYGSYLEPEVRVLRQFRDQYLLTNGPGRAFVNWYYTHSPGAAALIANHEPTRGAVRLLLTPLVYTLKYPLATLILMLSLGFTVRLRDVNTRPVR